MTIVKFKCMFINSHIGMQPYVLGYVLSIAYDWFQAPVGKQRIHGRDFMI